MGIKKKLDKLIIKNISTGKIIASFNISAKCYTRLSKLKTPTLRTVKSTMESAGFDFPLSDYMLDNYFDSDNPSSFEFKLKRIR